MIYFHKLLFACALVSSLSAGARAENWPGWRGPRGDGTSLETGAPVYWNATSNVLWKTTLPGVGHASPIVWEDRIFTVTALPETQERVLLCLDRRSGKILWQKTVLTAPLEAKHQLNSHSSSTPVTDGKWVYVAFLDVREILVAAYDFAGNQQWLVHPGPFASKHGFCSSPVLYEDKVIVNGDHDGDSYFLIVSDQGFANCFEAGSGKLLWQERVGEHHASLVSANGLVCLLSDQGVARMVKPGPAYELVAANEL